MADADELVLVGRIGKAHGLRGDVSVIPFTDDPDDRFAPGARLHTDDSSRPVLVVHQSRVIGGRWTVLFDGVADRTGAEALRGVQLFTRLADRPALDDPDDFYDTDLVGLRALLADDSELGEVAEVIHAPGGDVLVVRAGERDVLVPFVRQIVPSVDLRAGVLRVHPPEGLLDL